MNNSCLGDREISISMIRMISLLLIISCHMMQYLKIELAWWFNVGVQLFLCMSGYLFGKRKIGDIVFFLNHRIRKIVPAYYIAFISYGILQFFFARDIFKGYIFLGGLLLNKQLKGGGHLWFVSAILMCYVVTIFLDRYRNRYVVNKMTWLYFSITSFVLATVIFKFFIPLFFDTSWICCYIIGYCIGINNKENYIEFKYVFTLFFILAIVGNSIQIYIDYIAKMQIPETSKTYLYFKNYNHVFLGVALFMLMKKWFDEFFKINNYYLLNLSDKYSYKIYLVHQFVILGPFSLMSITPILELNIIIILVTIIALTYVLDATENRIIHIANSYKSYLEF